MTGVFETIAASRKGAETLVLDRFSSLGGHLGPGMVLAAGLNPEVKETLGAGFSATPKDLLEKIKKLQLENMKLKILLEECQNKVNCKLVG